MLTTIKTGGLRHQLQQGLLDSNEDEACKVGPISRILWCSREVELSMVRCMGEDRQAVHMCTLTTL